MSMRSSSMAAAKPAQPDDVARRVCEAMVDTTQRGARPCPFSLVGLGEGGLMRRDAALHAELESRYALCVQQKHDPGTGCACKGTNSYTLAELHKHCKDLVRNEGTKGDRGAVHSALKAHIEAAFPEMNREDAAANATLPDMPQPPVTISWPPILELTFSGASNGSH